MYLRSIGQYFKFSLGKITFIMWIVIDNLQIQRENLKNSFHWKWRNDQFLWSMHKVGTRQTVFMSLLKTLLF